MDMNQLFYQHQMALMDAGRARQTGVATANYDLVRHYGKRINRFREGRGLAPYFLVSGATDGSVSA